MHRSHSKQCHSGAARAGRSQWASDLQGEQSSTSNGIGSRKRKDETKRVARKFPILCAPALVPPLSAKPHSILVLEIQAAGR